MTRATLIGLSAFIAAIAMVAAVRQAWPHEPGTEWIMDGRYRNGQGIHCCSPGRDCQPIPDSDIEATPAGWRYKPTGEIVPESSTFRSRDPQGKHWRCEGTNGYFRYTRCLFVGGSV